MYRRILRSLLLNGKFFAEHFVGKPMSMRSQELLWIALTIPLLFVL